MMGTSFLDKRNRCRYISLKEEAFFYYEIRNILYLIVID